eukprot:CAMPEP_0118937338 /NCGR_PEP_ID=MMETSP1169-20130426/22380_1 /TAXON_ID=36882 /ORGANISM="Pyramimonas obovata, Strain CCMP722" /LENGTH=150 /DNA_ID=CAMNT_0006880931 /DNA_START=172 /DNA_END=621 /DNA_ORIENTATION=+
MEPQNKPIRTPTILGAKSVPEGQHSRNVQGILSSRPSESGVAPTAIKIMREEEKLTSSQLQLLNDKFEFCGERLEKILSNNTEYTVVGVLGAQAIGKSTLLSEIAGLQREPGEESMGWFPVGGHDPLSRCTHTTTSVDMRVSWERMIVVD